MEKSELRRDVVKRCWVLISPGRGKRPSDYKAAGKAEQKLNQTPPDKCPFCYYHERETGPELLAFHNEGCPPNGPCWRVRVVENKYPAVSSSLPYSESELCPDGVGVLECRLPGFGSHEVVVETPRHDQQFTCLSLQHISEVLRAYQCRLETFRSDRRFKYCQIFKNHGHAAGASMAHSHSQIIALPVVPHEVDDEVKGAMAVYKSSNACVFCDLVQHHQCTEGKLRLIDESPDFISICPYAARYPYETWVLPRRHNSNYGTATQTEIEGLAEMLKLTLRKLDEGFDYPPFNFMLQTAPLQDADVPYYHWYIRIVPHLVSLAGFELGSGCHINPVSPESAAEFLRSIKIQEDLAAGCTY